MNKLHIFILLISDYSKVSIFDEHRMEILIDLLDDSYLHYFEYKMFLLSCKLYPHLTIDDDDWKLYELGDEVKSKIDYIMKNGGIDLKIEWL